MLPEPFTTTQNSTPIDYVLGEMRQLNFHRNAFVYGRPSNLPSGNSTVPVPTLEDDDWKGQGEESGAMTSFVAMCRLSAILDSLLPLLAVSDRDEEVPHPKGILRDAAETLGEIDEGLPDLSFEGGYQGPGIRSFQLCHLGIALLICRIGVDLQTQMTESQLTRSMEHALGLVEDVIRFLEGLTSEDYASFWVPWASFQISHATALLLRTAMRLHRDGSTLTKLLDTAWTLLNRLVKAVERGVDSAWEVAEVAYPKVKALVNSLPNIPGSEGVKSRLAPPPDLGGVTQAAEPPLDLSTFLNQSEWVTADTALWIRDFTQTFMTET
ncbi:hypothetical protein TREMEDRAFT_56824 [Tremella mesenterica DSM 1558]|uniref:uncharacterized protein n=1 Tax=Tremella mesenterica (strain ATCC 24925 / CBS 8224 / DSM 1558 / NBRC 9311 / NRRL Y-6157 / RJB 2259-6 / UBC 559-6) TaxID=578456 RepID=UPI0003F4A2AF|nr:uncharacterized protein TREMEDRAFT_56824 [Tremella mesenterica DSM 1558]EIW70144.1 hypothetical protein TREMEDRAFT_56824 [Tremella mesenterica DSM 1558]